MAALTWTDTDDFTNVVEEVVNNDGLTFRHQGNRDGAGFHEDFYPDNYGEIKNNWYVDRTSDATCNIEFPGGQFLSLDFNAYTTDKYVFFQRPTNAILGKTDNFEIGLKFELDTDMANTGNAMFFGLFNSGYQDEDVSAVCQGFTDRKLMLHAHDTAGNGNTVTGTTVLAWSTPYWLLLRGDGSNLKLDCYSSQALYDAQGVGDVEDLSVAVASLTGTLYCNRLGWLSHRSAAATASVRTLIHWVEGDAANWITEHQGSTEGIFDLISYPDADAETKSAWTFDLLNGATSTASFVLGNLRLSFKAENSLTKRASYLRSTDINYTKDSTFDLGMKFKVPSATGTAVMFWGLFNSTRLCYKGNSIHMQFDDTAVYLGVTNSGDTAFWNGPIVTVADTDYWARLRNDGATITLDIYSSLALYNAGAAGDVGRASLLVANITGTVTCDQFGYYNQNDLVTGTVNTDVYWTDGDTCDWYSGVNSARADDTDLSSIRTVVFSSFNLTATGDHKYAIRKKTAPAGGYTADTNGGLYYTLAEVQAQPNENLYGVGFDVYLDGTNDDSAADDLALTHTVVDSTAPPMLSSMNLAAITGHPEIDDIILAWKQTVDPGAGLWFMAQFRQDPDGGNKEFLKQNADGTNGMYYEWEPWANFDLDDCYAFFNKDKGETSTGVYDNASRSFLIDGHTAGKVYKIIGVDEARNYSLTSYPEAFSSGVIPAVANVRYGVSYGYALELTGTLISQMHVGR